MRKRRLSWDFAVVYAVTVALAALVVLPVAVVVLGSFVDTSFLGLASEQWAGGSRNLFTLRWFRYVVDLYGPTMGFSAKLAAGSVLLCLGIGVPGGYVLARRPFPGSGWLEEAVLLPLSLPGIVLSVALIRAYLSFRGHWGLILAGHLLYTLPFMVRTVTNTLRSFDIDRLENAAASLGANFWQRLWLVVVPSLRHAMIVGSLLVLAISWGEFNISFLLNTPVHQTYPAALFATYTSNSFQVSSAATTLFLAAIIPVLLLVQRLGGRDTVAVEQGS